MSTTTHSQTIYGPTRHVLLLLNALASRWSILELNDTSKCNEILDAKWKILQYRASQNGQNKRGSGSVPNSNPFRIDPVTPTQQNDHTHSQCLGGGAAFSFARFTNPRSVLFPHFVFVSRGRTELLPAMHHVFVLQTQKTASARVRTRYTLDKSMQTILLKIVQNAQNVISPDRATFIVWQIVQKSGFSKNSKG